MSLKDIAVQLRAMDLYYHTAHNLVKGTVFYQDHESLSDYYEQVGCDYDKVIERAIPIEGDEAAEIKSQLKAVYEKVKGLPCVGVKENKVYFVKGMELEKELCSMIQEHLKSECSLGVETLLGDVCSRSEERQYLISRRIK
jgi:DNA-binding ferritin-like protein